MSVSHLFINIKSVKRQRISYNSIENLSNEIFYEIFDYLDGYLIMYCSYLLKIRIATMTCFGLDYEEWICSNRHRTLSFHFPTEVYLNTSHTFEHLNASYIRLESLILNHIYLSKLCEHVSNLNVLPQLVSLSIYFFFDDEDIDEIYQMIFSLPKLKSFRIQKLVDPEICQFHRMEIFRH